MKSTKNVDFFKALSLLTHYEICKEMYYLNFPRKKTLFEFRKKFEIICFIDSFGTEFYIILKGSVEVWVPLPKIVEQE